MPKLMLTETRSMFGTLNRSASELIHYPIRNSLLSQLTPLEFSRLAPFLEVIPLQTATILNFSNAYTKYAYFPIDTIISLNKVDKNGKENQIAMVGNEGMIGASILTHSQEYFNAVVQAKGVALRITGFHLSSEFQRHGVLFDMVFEYLHSLIGQIGITASCNRLHSIEQQLCRWLLLTLDRSSSKQIKMTHEGIGLCLGVRRESITEAAGKLHRLGAINYSRGYIDVTNRGKLEMMSCECYTQKTIHCKNKYFYS